MIIQQALTVATVATGAVFIFSTGNVNISMGAATALVATIAAKIYLKNGKYIIEYSFDYTSDEISKAIIYEENENGYIEIKGKKYRIISILDKEEKAKDKAKDKDKGEVSLDD